MGSRHRGSPLPLKFRVQKFDGNVLASILWDKDGTLLIDYLSKGQTINADNYSSLLVQLKDILHGRRTPGKVTLVVLFLHDNDSAHLVTAAPKKQHYLSFHCLDHPPYSPDLVLSDYHLFPGLEKQLKGRHQSGDRNLWKGGEQHVCLATLPRSHLHAAFSWNRTFSISRQLVS